MQRLDLDLETSCTLWKFVCTHTSFLGPCVWVLAATLGFKLVLRI